MADNPHLATTTRTAGADPDRATTIVVALHGRDQDPGYIAEHLAAPLADLGDVAWIMPAASGDTWYPGRFFEPAEANQPWLDHALDAVDSAIDAAQAHGPERVVLVGFSQGGCLVAEWLARRPRPLAAAAILTGSLVGPDDAPTAPGHPLDGLRVALATADGDDWVPTRRVEATAEALTAAGAVTTLEVFVDPEHRISPPAVAVVRALVEPSP